MNALLKAQLRYDNAEPEEGSGHADALQVWIDDAAERLIRGEDIVIRRRGWAVTTISQADFLLQVEQHLTCRLDEDYENAFAQLVIAALTGCATPALGRRLMGPTEHSLGALHEIAEGMVAKHAEAGLEADRKDDEL